jgi:hypothetical protein
MAGDGRQHATGGEGAAQPPLESSNSFAPDLLFEKGLTFLEEFGKLPLLVGDTVCDSRLVSGAGKGDGLLGELSDIVAGNRNAFFELHQRRGDHWSSIPEQPSTPGRRASLACFWRLLPRRAFAVLAKLAHREAPDRVRRDRAGNDRNPPLKRRSLFDSM